MGHNEIVFFAHLVAVGVLLLGAARLGRVWLTAFIAIATVLMNIVVMKNETLFGLAVTGGNVLYAGVFLANDVLNEHFGKQAARRAVVIGFAAGVAVVALMQFELLYTPDAADSAQPHLAYFFAFAHYPRIVLASMVTYLLAQVIDIGIYQAIRRRTGTGRLLWLRSNASTWIAQAFDTAFFTTVGLWGISINDWTTWWNAVAFAYLMKVGCAALNTPFLYLTTWGPLRPAGSMRVSGTAPSPSA
jgi:uncharacterized integral membrane protein (TIGR00697 family)